MKKFTERTKLSKKKRRELDRSQRVTWDMNPVTRTAPDKKKYNRKANRIIRDDDAFLF